MHRHPTSNFQRIRHLLNPRSPMSCVASSPSTSPAHPHRCMCARMRRPFNFHSANLPPSCTSHLSHLLAVSIRPSPSLLPYLSMSVGGSYLNQLGTFLNFFTRWSSYHPLPFDNQIIWTHSLSRSSYFEFRPPQLIVLLLASNFQLTFSMTYSASITSNLATYTCSHDYYASWAFKALHRIAASLRDRCFYLP